jgi:hypothetical protein
MVKPKTRKRIICLDFDGVIHKYISPWQGATTIPDPPVEFYSVEKKQMMSSIDWIIDFIIMHCTIPESIAPLVTSGPYEIHIYSSRSRYWGGRKAMKRWLVKNGLDKRYLEVIKFPLFKPPYHLMIDDRVYLFEGVFPTISYIEYFKPWNSDKK